MEQSLKDLVNILLLSLIAGLGTGLGGMIAVLRKPGKRSFGFLMGITAGVMISLSFLELVNQSWKLRGFPTATLGFGTGALFMLIMDMTLPHIRFGEREARSGADLEAENSQSPRSSLLRRSRGGPQKITNRPLYMTGMLLALGITVHNFPEGFAVGAGFMHEARFGLFIAIAILLHNIPEGIGTALPLFTSGVSKWNAFKVALFSGLVEPIGALMAAVFLHTFHNLVPAALAFAGGVMMFITLDELIPTAREYGHQHYTAVGIILGSIFVFLLSGLFGI
jgi:ZIP family zinc transporter